VARALPPEAEARLLHYGRAMGRIEAGEATLGAGERLGVRFAAAGQSRAQGDWNLSAWAPRWGETAIAAARDILALQGRQSPEEIGARLGPLFVRAASRVRAAPGAPVSLRRRAEESDVAVEAFRQTYAGFFAVEEFDLRFRRFAGSMSRPVTRAVFLSGDAATVLPYDPARDRVLLIEQFRPGPFARGDSQPWMLEPIAGRIDPGESPEEAARREALEEAGIMLGDLLPIARYYPTPGAKAEYLYAFLGFADLPDRLAGGLGGAEEENEDIRLHLVPFERLMELLETGEAENGPLLLSALFLARHRGKLTGRA
jgi:nudix-type nucleoside diphosphatase (YffH/AdpP family)